MIGELEVLKIVVKRLRSASISYMITGSIAVNFYATPRMTRDIDIIIEVSKDDARKLSSLFSDDFYVDDDSIIDALKTQQMFNIIHKEGIVKIDFIVRKDTEYRKTEFKRRRQIVFEEIEIDITAPEDLVLSKLYWAKESKSEMQIKDVKNLLKSVADMDKDYLRRWVKELKLEGIYQEVTL